MCEIVIIDFKDIFDKYRQAKWLYEALSVVPFKELLTFIFVNKTLESIKMSFPEEIVDKIEFEILIESIEQDIHKLLYFVSLGDEIEKIEFKHWLGLNNCTAVLEYNISDTDSIDLKSIGDIVYE